MPALAMVDVCGGLFVARWPKASFSASPSQLTSLVFARHERPEDPIRTSHGRLSRF